MYLLLPTRTTVYSIVAARLSPLPATTRLRIISPCSLDFPFRYGAHDASVQDALLRSNNLIGREPGRNSGGRDGRKADFPCSRNFLVVLSRPRLPLEESTANKYSCRQMYTRERNALDTSFLVKLQRSELSVARDN